MRKMLIVFISMMILVSCSPESKIKNLKNPESASEYYDNVSQLYSFAADLYSTSYEKLRSIKIKSSSYDEFIEKSEKISNSVDDSLMVYYDVMMEQLQYSIATNIDPRDRVLSSLESKEREVSKAEEKYNWILTDNSHVGNETSLKFAEAAFNLGQAAEEMKRITELLGE